MHHSRFRHRLRHPGGVSAQYLPALLPGGQVSQPGIRRRRTGALTGMGDRRPPRRLRLGGEKLGEGHCHCGGAANATINEALKPFYSFFTASLAALRRSSLYGEGNEKAQPFFVDCALVGGNCSMNFFTKSLLLEMPQENLIRRLQGFVILAVSGAKPLHCGDEYIVIAALPLELL